MSFYEQPKKYLFFHSAMVTIIGEKLYLYSKVLRVLKWESTKIISMKSAHNEGGKM